jgi:hypothetical protein
MILHGGSDGGLCEDVVKHRKAIVDDCSAKSEGIHKTSGEDGGATGVTKAEDPLKSSEQFKTKRTRI